MKRAAFPGTFDPITKGHESLARRAARVFDEVVVGVAAGVHKRSFFAQGERLRMTSEVFADVSNISVYAFDGLLADFMRERQCQILVRGLRSVSDFEFETQLADINKSLAPGLETVFFMPDRDFAYLSSTIVREVAMLGGEVDGFVSPPAAKMLRRRFAAGGGNGA